MEQASLEIDRSRLADLRLREQGVVEHIRRSNPCVQVEPLSNIEPKERVKYIFVAMEPSLGRWGKWDEETKRGLKNFMLSWEDFILHYCVTNYLSPSYFLTDISKAAMKATIASALRNYALWLPLLKEEIEIVGQDGCTIICVGKRVHDTLAGVFPSARLRQTLHYSPVAARHRTTEKRLPSEVDRVTSEDILEYAQRHLTDNCIPDPTRSRILTALKQSKAQLSDSRKALMHRYHEDFQRVGCGQ